VKIYDYLNIALNTIWISALLNEQIMDRVYLEKPNLILKNVIHVDWVGAYYIIVDIASGPYRSAFNLMSLKKGTYLFYNAVQNHTIYSEWASCSRLRKQYFEFYIVSSIGVPLPHISHYTIIIKKMKNAIWRGCDTVPTAASSSQPVCICIQILHIIIIIGEAKPHHRLRNNTRITESHVPIHTAIT